MLINLSLLPSDEKNKIELDKQASYLVWQLKQAKIAPDGVLKACEKIRDEQQRAFFEQSIQKYKQMMQVI